MKMIEAVLRPEDFETIKKALKSAGYVSLTAHPVRGRGVQGGIPPYDLLPKMKIEIVVPDKDVESVIETIVRHAKRGIPGDGKIFILPVYNAVRIRTGERGEEALR
ncbi:P-II family nitrogen regulator [Thermococcus sp. Bubb.Bath]|uniref:P-II family nitrogen regulator n=1 Tax=Thermococcus sp. Bubb.Bath TaxID=1638242 RepID=UPI00143C0BA1|nr:P-II family nitrogen regulator [Thermococcus sp. Bubb.Bath]NJF26078.1 P-II family nitrogen regulator [Thermococcus sp. Bubb.Bath]